MEGVCLWCKEGFDKNRNADAYCCQSCRDSARKYKERERAKLRRLAKKTGTPIPPPEWKVPRECRGCGQMFDPVRVHQKVCGRKECAHARKGAAPKEKIPCAYCGKPFVPKQSNYKTCSPECRDNNARGVAKRGMEALRADAEKPDKPEPYVDKFKMDDPWPGLDFLPPGQTSWYSAQMMPVI